LQVKSQLGKSALNIVFWLGVSVWKQHFSLAFDKLTNSSLLRLDLESAVTAAVAAASVGLACFKQCKYSTPEYYLI
jgi:hypothetical protein